MKINAPALEAERLSVRALGFWGMNKLGSFLVDFLFSNARMKPPQVAKTMTFFQVLITGHKCSLKGWSLIVEGHFFRTIKHAFKYFQNHGDLLTDA